MTIDTSRPWPKLSPVQRFGPAVLVVALLVGAGAVATVKGQGTSERESVAGGGVPQGGDGIPYVDNPLLAVTYAEAEEAGTLDEHDWGDRCDPETGRIMQPSVYAPPCVPVWEEGTWTGLGGETLEDNGGATAPGVTADEIVIAYYIPGPQDLLATAEALGILDPPDVRIRAMENMAVMGNQTYELYGRRVVIKSFQATGDGTDPAAARADARRVAEDLEAFASVGGPTQSLAYQEELARRGVLCISCSPAAPDPLYQELAPYTWAVLASPDQLVQGVLDFGVRNLIGHPARFAGDETLRTQQRQIAVVHYDQDPPIFQDLTRRLTERYEAQGVNAEIITSYLLDLNTVATQASAIIGRLKQEAITTVVFAGDPLMLIELTAAATRQNYYPEWQITGTVFTDTTSTARLLDQQQWVHAFGASSSPARTRPEDSDSWRLWEWFFGEAPEAKRTLPIYWPQMNLLFTGLHMAGPDLTAESFAGGLFRYPPSGGGPTTPRISFGDHGLFDDLDFVGIDDFTVAWWDPEMEGPDEQQQTGIGMWRYPNGGERHLLNDPKEVPEDLLFQDRDDSPGILGEIPAEDTSPAYPPIPGSPAAG